MRRREGATGLVDAVIDFYPVEIHGQGRAGATQHIREVSGKTQTEID